MQRLLATGFAASLALVAAAPAVAKIVDFQTPSKRIVCDPSSPVPAYGRSRTLGRFTCTSRTTGLTCRDRRSGHGFEVSRQRQRLF